MEEIKFKNKYRIPTNRLVGYDYAAEGAYFVTICTKNKIPYFGEISAQTDNYPSHSPSYSPSYNPSPVKTDNYPSHSPSYSPSYNPSTVKTDNYPSHSPSYSPSPVKDTHNYAYLQATEIGKIAFEFWNEIPKHFPFVILDTFVIMPDHLHGILIFNKPNKNEWIPNKFGPQSQNLGSVIEGLNHQ